MCHSFIKPLTMQRLPVRADIFPRWLCAGCVSGSRGPRGRGPSPPLAELEVLWGWQMWEQTSTIMTDSGSSFQWCPTLETFSRHLLLALLPDKEVVGIEVAFGGIGRCLDQAPAYCNRTPTSGLPLSAADAEEE